MIKKYLVTGGTGFLGRAIVNALVDEGHSVSILDNESRGSLEKFDTLAKKIKFFKGDIRDADFVKKTCKNIDVVLHLAYINGTENFYSKPDLVLEVATKGIVNVLDAAISQNVKEFYLASSSEVYSNPPIIPTPEDVPLVIPNPDNPRYSYSGGKIISELMTINYSKYFKKTAIFRPHNVYGPAMGFEHVIPQFILRMKNELKSKNGDFVIQGNGKESRSFIYIDDFTAGLMLFLKKAKNREIYNIGTLNEVTIRELALLTAKVYGIKINIVKGDLLEGSPKRRCPDISKIKKFGFSPKISLEEGLKKTIEWYVNEV